MLETALRVLTQAVSDDPIEIVRDAFQRFRLLVQNGGERGDSAVTLEGAPPGHHFVKHGSEGEDVRAGIDGLALGLLGRHVGDGAQDGAFLGGGLHGSRFSFGGG